MRGIPVYSLVAASGTGKTTVMEKLIREFKTRGLRVAAVKHDAHEFEIDKEGKDSWRMTQAGADVTVIASANKSAIMENRPISAEELITRIGDVDLILTEGFKFGPWPKILIVRKAAGEGLMIALDDCLVVMTDMFVETKTPCIHLDDIKLLADIITGNCNLHGDLG